MFGGYGGKNSLSDPERRRGKLSFETTSQARLIINFPTGKIPSRSFFKGVIGCGRGGFLGGLFTPISIHI